MRNFQSSDIFKIYFRLCCSYAKIPALSHIHEVKLKSWQWPTKPNVIWSLFLHESPLYHSPLDSLHPSHTGLFVRVLNIPRTLLILSFYTHFPSAFSCNVLHPILALLIPSSTLGNFVQIPSSQCWLSGNPPLFLYPYCFSI